MEQTQAQSVPPRSPLMELLAIALPSVATMTSYTVMQFVDKLMVSRIGPDPVYVGAQGNGALASFVPVSIVMGTLTIINTYVSQNLGAGTPRRGPAYVWNGLWIVLAAWLALIPYGLAMPVLFAAFGHDGPRLELESAYGQILVYGSVLTMATRALAQFFYGMHRPAVVMIAGVTANLVNFGLNYVLIFGHLGLPALGVVGSALATILATLVELLIPLAIFLGPKMNALYGTRGAWRFSKERLRELLRLGWPGGVMFGNEMICWGIFMVGLVGLFGPNHSTAAWIAHQYMSLSFMPAVGISVAVTAVVGRYMGMGRPDLARRRALLGLSLALVYMGLCAVVFVVWRAQLVGLFIEDNVETVVRGELIALGSGFLIATAAFQLFDAVAMTLAGALRGAGDTVWPGIATLVLSWTVIVGGGFALVRFAPGLSSLGPWIAASAYVILLSLAILVRFLAGRWQTIRLVAPALV